MIGVGEETERPAIVFDFTIITSSSDSPVTNGSTRETAGASGESLSAQQFHTSLSDDDFLSDECTLRKHTRRHTFFPLPVSYCPINVGEGIIIT